MDEQAYPLEHLPIDYLQPNPLQPRGVITAQSLEELADSIKEHGVLEPLIAAKTPAGYQIIAGERRWRAAKIAGLETVPVYIRKTNPRGMLEMALVENVQRTDLNPIERAKAFERLQRDFGYNTTEVAQRVSKSLPYVSNALALLRLPDVVKDALLSEKITEGHGRALNRIDDPQFLINTYKKVIDKGLNVRQTEEIARTYAHEKSEQRHYHMTEISQTRLLTEELNKIKKDLQETLGERSKVDLMQSSRQAKVQIVFKGTPDETNPRIRAFHRLLKELELTIVDQDN